MKNISKLLLISSIAFAGLVACSDESKDPAAAAAVKQTEEVAKVAEKDAKK